MTAPATSQTFDDFEMTVLRVVRTTLEDTTEEIGVDTGLLGLPGFDSLVIVTVVEAMESDTGVEVPPEVLVPETFESVRTLAAAAWPAAIAAQEEVDDR